MYDTMAILGIWDHKSGNYQAPTLGLLVMATRLSTLASRLFARSRRPCDSPHRDELGRAQIVGSLRGGPQGILGNLAEY